MWNLPESGIEPLSPALAGGFLTTGPPGKSYLDISVSRDSLNKAEEANFPTESSTTSRFQIPESIKGALCISF